MGPSLKSILQRSLVLVLALTLPACALSPLAVPVAISGSAAGINYSITNVAYKTISSPMERVEAAVRKALKKMEIKETGREAADGKLKINAVTEKLNIEIGLEAITPATTQISVDVVRDVLLKDKATATEIIVQTEKALK